jgi:hypothetical protein
MATVEIPVGLTYDEIVFLVDAVTEWMDPGDGTVTAIIEGVPTEVPYEEEPYPLAVSSLAKLRAFVEPDDLMDLPDGERRR